MPQSVNRQENLTSYWAKTHRDSGCPALTVRDHCIHVGAVAQLIGTILPKGIQNYRPQGLATLAALHDVGKITLGFQKKCPRWNFYPDIKNVGLEGNHALVSQAFFGSLFPDKNQRNTAYWSISLGGHHGRYNSDKPRPPFRHEKEGTLMQRLRKQLTEELVSLFGNLPEGAERPDVYQLHWFTGLITFADWIGSNEDFFPLSYDGILKDHTTLTQAQSQAQEALNRIEWNAVTPRAKQSFSQLFPFSPNPLQETLTAACDAPGLYIVEATMGLGKTEAALAASYQRWLSGEERGIYFALPTQLTSNRIFERISPFLEKTIDSASTLTLIHGNSWLNEQRTLHIHATNANGSSAWISDAQKWFSSSRRALIAPFGVGTIDQALLSVLHTKYASLRFFGLAGKTVILDEVHSYDEYTFSLICKLVTELTKAGSSVIVLSATLTQKARQSLVEAAGGNESSAPTAYPLITTVKRQSDTITTDHYPLPNTKNSQTFHLRHVTLPEGLDQDSATLQAAAEAASKGACVLIIRNTVKTAQTTYNHIKSLISDDIPVGLLHSRFPFLRRQEIEAKWVGMLEKGSVTRPEGCILVATQVVEQSVDIDADLLITDLAPTDLLLQRLGRTHRHPRPRPQGFESPQCWILHPATSEVNDAKLLKKQLGSSAWIYPPHTLIRSGAVWKEKESVCLPDDIRHLLETSSQKSTDPTEAESSLFETLTSDIKKKQNTSQTRTRTPLNTLALSDDDQGDQTRWGNQKSATLILLTQKPIISGHTITLQFLSGPSHSFSPYEFDFQLAKLLHENAVRVPAYLFGSSRCEEEWLNGYFFETCALAIPEHQIGGTCELYHLTETLKYTLNYNQHTGISFEKSDTAPTDDFPFEDEEECWW